MATVTDLFAVALQHHQAGDLQRAEQYYHHILQAVPHYADCHHLLGVIAHQRGDHETAAAWIRHALALNPGVADYYTNLGAVYQALDRFDEAAKCLRLALRIHPELAEAHCNLGNALQRLHNFEEAIRCYEEALRLQPQLAEAHYNLGLVLGKQGKYQEEIGHYQRALQYKPDHLEAYNNMGNALMFQGLPREAEACYREALRLKPHYAEAHSNLGAVLFDQAKLDEADSHYVRALQLNPNYAEAHWNRSLSWLLVGDFERGWPAYEWRWARAGFPRRSFAQPRWDGSPLHGRTILLYAEQGLGDAVQFVRYAALVKQRGGRVVVECHPALVPMLCDVAGVDQAVPFGASLPPFDVQAPLLSLPGIFRTSLATIPANVPYLHADAELVEKWRQQCSRHAPRDDDLTRSVTTTFKVGIAWQGNPALRGDRLRSIPLAQFTPLAKEDVELFSLQVGKGTEQLSSLAGQFRITDLGSQFDSSSLAHAAAVIMNLDLIVTVDTAVAHLAGALGAPVWVALPLVPDWRWLLQREDSPWYPTMRLFRQTQAGQWQDVFERMVLEMEIWRQR